MRIVKYRLEWVYNGGQDSFNVFDGKELIGVYNPQPTDRGLNDLQPDIRKLIFQHGMDHDTYAHKEVGSTMGIVTSWKFPQILKLLKIDDHQIGPRFFGIFHTLEEVAMHILEVKMMNNPKYFKRVGFKT